MNHFSSPQPADDAERSGNWKWGSDIKFKSNWATHIGSDLVPDVPVCVCVCVPGARRLIRYRRRRREALNTTQRTFRFRISSEIERKIVDWHQGWCWWVSAYAQPTEMKWNVSRGGSRMKLTCSVRAKGVGEGSHKGRPQAGGWIIVSKRTSVYGGWRKKIAISIYSFVPMPGPERASKKIGLDLFWFPFMGEWY